MDPPKYVDLFAGAGGISLGLTNSGWRGLFAVEKSDMAFSTLNYNLIKEKKHFDWPEWLPEKAYDINNFLIEYREKLIQLRGKVDLVAGGPPCQGFSFAGRRNHADERNMLVHSYIEFVKLVQPRYVFLENVRGFTVGFTVNNKKGMAFSTTVSTSLKEMGFFIKEHLINFYDFGVPQNRIRYVLLGSVENNVDDLSQKLFIGRKAFLNEKGLTDKNQITTKKAISDLEKRHGDYRSEESSIFTMGKYGPVRSNYQKFSRKCCALQTPDSHRFARHSCAVKNKFVHILEKCERNKTVDENTKKVLSIKKHSLIPLAADKPSPTLTTLPDDFIHYSEPRILTAREYARIQSFPDWYIFKSNYTTGGPIRRERIPRYTQIGNAVPPLFVEQIGNVMRRNL